MSGSGCGAEKAGELQGMTKKEKDRQNLVRMAEKAAKKESARRSKMARELSKSPEFIALFENFKAQRSPCSPPRYGFVSYNNDGWTKLRPCFV